MVRDGQETRIHAQQCGLVAFEVREAWADRAEEDFQRRKALPESGVQNDVTQFGRQVNVELVGQNLGRQLTNSHPHPVEAFGSITNGSLAHLVEQDQHQRLAVHLLGYLVEQLLDKVRPSNRLDQEHHVLNNALYARELFDQVHAQVVQHVQRATKREDELIILDA